MDIPSLLNHHHKNLARKRTTETVRSDPNVTRALESLTNRKLKPSSTRERYLP
jgi:hypothetical protein